MAWILPLAAAFLGAGTGWWLCDRHARRRAVLYWKRRADAYRPDDHSDAARLARMMVTATHCFPPSQAR